MTTNPTHPRSAIPEDVPTARAPSRRSPINDVESPAAGEIPESHHAADGRSTTRWTIATGVVGSLLWVGALSITGDSPGVDAPARSVANYAAGHGSLLLLTGGLSAAGAMSMLGFFGGLYVVLRQLTPRHRPLLILGLAATVVTMTLVMVGFAAVELLGFGHAAASPALAQTFNDTVWVVFAVSGVPTALTVASFGIAMNAVPGLQWSGRFAALVVLAHLAASAALADTGTWTPSGAVGKTAPTLFILWALMTCAALARTARNHRSAQL